MTYDFLPRADEVVDRTLHNASLSLDSDEQAIADSMVRNRLRRMLGKEHGLDAVYVDLIHILTGPDMAEQTLALLKARNPELFKES